MPELIPAHKGGFILPGGTAGQPPRNEALHGWSISYYIIRVRVHDSAFKHGCALDDITQAASEYLTAIELADDPRRELRLGFDLHRRLLEVVVLFLDGGNELVIHAMKARPQYFDLLP